MPPRTSGASWNDVKAKLATLDRAELVALIRDLYGVSSVNRTFLHTHFALGPDLLAPYKTAIDRWLWPDFLKHEELSVPRARKALTAYRKAVGRDAGLAELLVFWCERATGFVNEYGGDGREVYLEALVDMFEEALDVIASLEPDARTPLHDRLWAVRDIAQGVGYGVAEDMEDAFERFGVN
ncbi:MAG: hypothetical protein MUF30_12170 [Burkholderiales bacterium]|jgi:hypothetical protein|nr:hypothetical protein [Burkholderiales bacterium]